MSDLANQTKEDKPLRTNPKFINEFGIVCFSLSISTLVGAIVVAFVYRTELGNATDKGPLWLVALPQVLAIVGGSFAGFIWSRSWIQKQEINDQKVLELANQKLALEDRQKEFEHQKLESVKNRHIADTQFNSRLLADQHQFQSNKLEDRFNRILDDFAHKDAANRAGAASRFVSMAQSTRPGADLGAPLDEENNPYYMPSVRQLSQRLVMDDNKSVCKAIQDALSGLSQWTSDELERQTDPEVRKTFEKMQAKLVHELADVNRTAYGAWLESLALQFRIRMSGDQIRQISTPGTKLAETIIAFLKDGKLRCPPGLGWSRNSNVDARSLFESYCKDQRFINMLTDSLDSLEVVEATTYGHATQALVFARNALADVLRTLCSPQEEPEHWNEWHRPVDIDVTRCFLVGADLRMANLQGINFAYSNLQGAEIFGSNLQNGDFEGTKIYGADFYLSHLEDATFYEADIQSARLEKSHLQRAYFRYANISEANLKEAEMQGTEILGSNLIQAKNLPVSVLESEFRDRDYDSEEDDWLFTVRPLDDKEYAYYLEIKQKLVDEGTIQPDYAGPHDRPKSDNTEETRESSP